MRTNRDYLFRGCSSKGLSFHHLCVAGNQSQAGKWENFIVKKGNIRVCSYWRLLAWEAGHGPTRSGLSYEIDLRSTFSFIWLVLS